MNRKIWLNFYNFLDHHCKTIHTPVRSECSSCRVYSPKTSCTNSCALEEVWLGWWSSTPPGLYVLKPSSILLPSQPCRRSVESRSVNVTTVSVPWFPTEYTIPYKIMTTTDHESRIYLQMFWIIEFSLNGYHWVLELGSKMILTDVNKT